MSKKKNRVGIIYSTNPDFQYQYENYKQEPDTLPEFKQKLYISLDKKNKKGKVVTVISNFIGKYEDLENLEKKLKEKCATGGTSKNGEIIIQGDFRHKIEQILNSLGYKTVRKN